MEAKLSWILLLSFCWSTTRVNSFYIDWGFSFPTYPYSSYAVAETDPTYENVEVRLDRDWWVDQMRVEYNTFIEGLTVSSTNGHSWNTQSIGKHGGIYSSANFKYGKFLNGVKFYRGDVMNKIEFLDTWGWSAGEFGTPEGSFRSQSCERWSSEWLKNVVSGMKATVARYANGTTALYDISLYCVPEPGSFDIGLGYPNPNVWKLG